MALSALGKAITNEATHVDKFKDAAKCYSCAAALLPQDLDIAFRLGNAYYHAHQYGDAAATFQVGPNVP
jgi:thioredoxin-like negative regulator of GroEL